MTATDIKSRLTAHIWRSIAQSDVDISAIPRDQLQALVDAIADGVVEALAGSSADVVPDWDITAETDDELVLWSGRPLWSLIERYAVTTDRVRVHTGLLSKENQNLELVRIQDIDYRQSLTERVLGIGDVQLHSSDPSHPLLTLRNVRHPERVHDIIRRATLSARRRYRFSFQDEM